MAEFQFAKPGLNSVGQYQMSGIPYASSSIVVSNTAVTEIEFPTITKFVTITNTHTGASKPLKVGFSSTGILNDKNHFVLDNGESYTGEFRVSSVYLAGSSAPTTASVIAGLTQIERGNLLTNWSASDGSSIYGTDLGGGLG
jgi:hypothetical protein|tara:strand:- start:174 stop:599 length:426 start_codon:yes stop_codon:yes gene_type:complete